MGKGRFVGCFLQKAFTLLETMMVALVIAGLLVVMIRVYRLNLDYEMAHQIDDFIKAVDKGLFVANVTLQSYSFRSGSVSGNEGDNGGLYLMVSDTSFDSVYRALMEGDCMVRCFDGDDYNNSLCGGDVAVFSGMCRDDDQAETLCLAGVFDKRYMDTYMVPTVVQGRLFFPDLQVFNSNYQVVKDLKSGAMITVGQLVKLVDIAVDLSVDPRIIDILQSMDSRYQRRGNSVVYLLNNGAGHFVIVRNGYVCQ